MIDVVLYRVDNGGKLDLIERKFPTFRRLVKFFASDEGDIWDWAEVTDDDGVKQTRYEADELRAMADLTWVVQPPSRRTRRVRLKIRETIARAIQRGRWASRRPIPPPRIEEIDQRDEPQHR